ncbi:protein regulator of cytokinesis 1 [Fopius arisanus]|uniref:Prc1 protein n=1 Tax=Fopius arisanus TaxID=64838 RepID=A0A0C9QN90_9HYME|nr:PREDICTED: protein regulator of cytokinesis 1-like [Fopius arisanus]
MAEDQGEVWDYLEDELIEKLTQGTRDVIPEFYKEWQVIGLDAATKKRFQDVIVEQHRGILMEMLTETKHRRSTLMNSIDKMKQELQILSRDLRTLVDLGGDGLSLLNLEKHLREQLHSLEEVKKTRLSQLEELFSKETSICSVMGSKPVGLDSTIPSEEELQAYEIYITNQEAEMLRLKAVFKEVRLEIIKSMEEMGSSPKLDIERQIVNEHHKFVFNPSNMQKLEELRQEVLEKLALAREIAEAKRQELLVLLEYLDVPQTNYEEFLEKNSGCDQVTISLLNKEIKKCKELRIKNISKFVEKIRGEIRTLWDACKFSEKQRNAFQPYKYQNYTEEVLALHELELKELQKFYKNNEKIYELFNQHQEMREKLAELDIKAEDPNRLNNRGGQLLEDEKARKLVTKNLPKAEARLRDLLNEFEEENQTPFTFNGLTFDEYLQKEDEKFNEEKENIRLARAKAKDEKKSIKKTPLSASKRNLATAMSLRAMTSVKRKLPMEKSPALTGNKKRLVQSEKMRPTLACGSKVRRSGKVSRRLLSNSLNKESPRKRKNAKLLSDSSTDNLNLQSYEVFQEHLSSRNELRSTLLSEQVLKNMRSDGEKMKTPVKTPIKPMRKPPLITLTPHVTPKAVPRRPSRSPRITSTPRLTTAPMSGLSHLKL